MLGTKSKPKPAPTTSSSSKMPNAARESNETCVVAPGALIEGKFSSTENIRIDGAIKGDVKCDLRLVMGDSGKIKGNVTARNAIIMGKIEGEVHVAETLHLKSSAVIRGAVHAKYMVVDEGARYFGDCQVGG